jgi:predicted acyl esterase
MNGTARLGVITSAALALTLLGAPCLAQSQQTVMVPMRDGVKLATDIYLPAGDGPWPTILVMTPYGKKGAGVFGPEANRRGYAYVAQDFRGRFDSEGVDYPVFVHNGWGEHQDGYDTVEWIAGQKWSDGKVGGFGISAPACALNMTAPSRPPHLTCNYVSVAFSSMYTQGAYPGGAFLKSLLEDWFKGNKFDPKNLELIRAHPNYDDYWRQMDPQRVASRVNVPTMFVGGWYDIFNAGSIDSFVTINKQGDVGARDKCRLVMEAYGHGRNEDLVFPYAAQPGAADPWKWFDIWLKNDGKGIEEIPVVQYFVMGDPADPNTPGNKWRTAADWPVPAEPIKVYFHTDNKLRLRPPEELFGSLAYKYDPKNPVPTIGGANLTISKGPMDQRPVENRPDVLLFTSPALDRYVEITGPVQVKLWASSTTRDTDFTAKFCDVYPDGRSIIVLDGILRAGHRNSLEQSEPLEAGEIYEMDIDLWSTSLVISPGHRVRIAISSSNAPRFEPNPNTGKPSGTDDKTEIAVNTIYMNASHPSHIVLPVAAH